MGDCGLSHIPKEKGNLSWTIFQRPWHRCASRVWTKAETPEVNLGNQVQKREDSTFTTDDGRSRSTDTLSLNVLPCAVTSSLRGIESGGFLLHWGHGLCAVVSGGVGVTCTLTEPVSSVSGTILECSPLHQRLEHQYQKENHYKAMLKEFIIWVKYRKDH